MLCGRGPVIPWAAMKTSIAALSPLLAALVVVSAGPLGCGAGTPPAESAENSGDDASAESPMDIGSRSPHAKPDPSVGVTVKDDDTKEAKPCISDDFPDLIATLSQAACEIPSDKASDKQRDLSSRLEVTVAPDAPKVAPGGTSKVTITLHNKGEKPLSLDFAVDPEPRFEFQAFTAKGARADQPAGDAPPLPQEVQNAPEPDKGIARITLAPNGHAKLVATWTAVKYKWTSKDKAKGALPGRGYPTEPAGSLPKGKYVLRVLMPLLNITEGVDHEMTQPRAPIEVGRVP
jgi:hypothetical protein